VESPANNRNRMAAILATFFTGILLWGCGDLRHPLILVLVEYYIEP